MQGFKPHKGLHKDGLDGWIFGKLRLKEPGKPDQPGTVATGGSRLVKGFGLCHINGHQRARLVDPPKGHLRIRQAAISGFGQVGQKNVIIFADQLGLQLIFGNPPRRNGIAKIGGKTVPAHSQIMINTDDFTTGEFPRNARDAVADQRVDLADE